MARLVGIWGVTPVGRAPRDRLPSIQVSAKLLLQLKPERLKAWLLPTLIKPKPFEWVAILPGILIFPNAPPLPPQQTPATTPKLEIIRLACLLPPILLVATSAVLSPAKLAIALLHPAKAPLRPPTNRPVVPSPTLIKLLHLLLPTLVKIALVVREVAKSRESVLEWEKALPPRPRHRLVQKLLPYFRMKILVHLLRPVLFMRIDFLSIVWKLPLLIIPGTCLNPFRPPWKRVAMSSLLAAIFARTRLR